MNPNALVPAAIVTSAASEQPYNTKVIQQMDSAHYLHPFTRSEERRVGKECRL